MGRSGPHHSRGALAALALLAACNEARASRSGHADLVIVPLDGSPAVALTDDEASDGHPGLRAVPLTPPGRSGQGVRGERRPDPR